MQSQFEKTIDAPTRTKGFGKFGSRDHDQWRRLVEDNGDGDHPQTALVSTGIRIANALERLIEKLGDTAVVEEALVGPEPLIAERHLLGGLALSSLAADLKRIADKCDPPPPDLVDTEYVADKLGVTLKRISQMALAGDIPASCIVPGTGQGKPWKFYRSRIDPWIAAR